MIVSFSTFAVIWGPSISVSAFLFRAFLFDTFTSIRILLLSFFTGLRNTHANSITIIHFTIFTVYNSIRVFNTFAHLVIEDFSIRTILRYTITLTSIGIENEILSTVYHYTGVTDTFTLFYLSCRTGVYNLGNTFTSLFIKGFIGFTIISG